MGFWMRFEDALGMIGDGWRAVNRWFRWMLFAMLVWALLIYGVGAIGLPVFSLIFAIVSAAIVFCLGVAMGQPAIGLFAFLPIPQIRGAARWVVAVFALEITMGAYFVVVPVGYNNTTRYMGAVAVFLMVVAILFRLAVQESWVKWVRAGLWGTAVFLTAAIFLMDMIPKEVEAASKYREHELDAKAAQEVKEGQGVFTAVWNGKARLWLGDPKSPPSAQQPPAATQAAVAQVAPQTVSQPKEEFARVRLGTGWSQEVEVPRGSRYFFEGPPQARVKFWDGTEGSIDTWFGNKRGIFRFSGPAGEEVVVKIQR